MTIYKILFYLIKLIYKKSAMQTPEQILLFILSTLGFTTKTDSLPGKGDKIFMPTEESIIGKIQKKDESDDFVIFIDDDENFLICKKCADGIVRPFGLVYVPTCWGDYSGFASYIEVTFILGTDVYNKKIGYDDGLFENISCEFTVYHIANYTVFEFLEDGTHGKQIYPVAELRNIEWMRDEWALNDVNEEVEN